MHDHRRGFLDLFPDGLHHVSRERRRKILRIYRVDRRHLLSDAGFTRSACLCNVASGDYYTCSGFSSPMGSPQTNRTLDGPNLAIRLGHRSARLFDALQMVSARRVSAVLRAPERQSRVRHRGIRDRLIEGR